MPSATLEASTPAFAHTNPCARLGDRRGRRDARPRAPSPLRSTAVAVRRRGPRGPPPSTRPSASRRRRRPRAAERRERVGEHRREVVAGRRSRGDRRPAMTASAHASSSSAARATASARSSSTMIVSVAAHRMPSASTAGDRRRVDVVEQPGRRAGRGSARRRRPRVTSIPTAGISLSAIPATGPPPTIPLTPTARVAPGGDRVADARAPRGSARSTRPGSTGRTRRRRPSAIASSTPGAGRRVGGPAYRTPSRRRPPAAATQYSWKWRSSGSPVSRSTHSIRVSTGSSVTGSSRAPHAEPRGDPARDLRQRRAARPAARSGTGGSPDRGRRARTRPVGASKARELLGRAEGLVAAAPAALAIEDVAEPVGDRVGVRRRRAARARRCRRRRSRRRSGPSPGTTRASPRRNFPAPIPPASAATFMNG